MHAAQALDRPALQPSTHPCINACVESIGLCVEPPKFLRLRPHRQQPGSAESEETEDEELQEEEEEGEVQDANDHCSVASEGGKSCTSRAGAGMPHIPSRVTINAQARTKGAPHGTSRLGGHAPPGVHATDPTEATLSASTKRARRVSRAASAGDMRVEPRGCGADEDNSSSYTMVSCTNTITAPLQPITLCHHCTITGGGHKWRRYGSRKRRGRRA